MDIRSPPKKKNRQAIFSPYENHSSSYFFQKYIYKTLNNTLQPKGGGVNSLKDYVWEHALKET